MRTLWSIWIPDMSGIRIPAVLGVPSAINRVPNLKPTKKIVKKYQISENSTDSSKSRFIVVTSFSSISYCSISELDRSTVAQKAERASRDRKVPSLNPTLDPMRRVSLSLSPSNFVCYLSKNKFYTCPDKFHGFLSVINFHWTGNTQLNETSNSDQRPWTLSTFKQRTVPRECN